MKHLIFVLIIFTLTISIVSAQDLVNPDNPPLKLSETRGYITINEFTTGFGFRDISPPYAKSFVGITTIHGYQVNKNFVLGGGTGALFYNSGTLIPLFLDFRFSFHTGTFTPYLFGDGGMLFNTNSILKLLINPGAGIRYAISRNVALNLGAGVWVQTDETRDSFVNFKLGVVYKPE